MEPNLADHNKTDKPRGKWTLPPRPEKLSIKQRKFAQHLLKTGDPTGSVIASYDTTDRHVASVMAAKLQRIPSMVAYINDHLEKANLSAEWVLKGHKWLAENAENDVVKTKNFELVGKHLKLYADSSPIMQDVNILINLGGGHNENREVGQLHRLGEISAEADSSGG